MSWKNVEDKCMLCNMDKRTEWHEETDDFVVAEKLSGGPFIVIKDHKEDIDDEELQNAHKLVSDLFGDHNLTVRMNTVKHHWHAHITTKDIEQDLSDE